MKKGKQPHPLQKHVDPNPRVIIASVVGVLLVALVILLLPKLYSLFTSKQNQVIVGKTYHVSPFPTAGPTVTPIPPKTFTSTNLGISFQYPSDIGSKIFEEGNKIHIDATREHPDDGFSIEVFQKTASEPLTDAIKRQFIQGYPTDTCEAKMVDSSFDPGTRKAPQHPTYQYAIISLTQAAQDKYTTLDERGKVCPYLYTFLGNGTEYFLADTAHPTKYLFLNIGQSGLPLVGLDYDWQGTISFLDTPQQ